MAAAEAWEEKMIEEALPRCGETSSDGSFIVFALGYVRWSGFEAMIVCLQSNELVLLRKQPSLPVRPMKKL